MMIMLGEIGRLGAKNEGLFKEENLYTELIKELSIGTEDTTHLLISNVRSGNKNAHKAFEELDWTPVSFEPSKYLLEKREDAISYVKPYDMAFVLRRNNPHVIPEATKLAETVLRNLNFPVDVIVETEAEGYPTDRSYDVEVLEDQQGMAAFFRIQRGSVQKKEVFGNFSVAHGFFHVSDSNSQYLLAMDGDTVIAGLGFIVDAVDKRLQIIELLGNRGCCQRIFNRPCR